MEGGDRGKMRNKETEEGGVERKNGKESQGNMVFGREEKGTGSREKKGEKLCFGLFVDKTCVVLCLFFGALYFSFLSLVSLSFTHS